jgi:hypothetical protein
VSYDLKNLKKALDEQIPMPKVDKEVLARAMQHRKKKNNAAVVRALTAAGQKTMTPARKPERRRAGNETLGILVLKLFLVMIYLLRFFMTSCPVGRPDRSLVL